MAAFNVEQWLRLGRLRWIVSLLMFIFSIAYLFGSLSLPIGELSQPGAGLFPTAVGIFLSFFTFFGLIQCWQSKPLRGEGDSFPHGKDLRREMGLLSALICFGVFFRILGYVISSAILLIAVLYLLEMRGWARIFLISILASGGSYYLFAVILQIPFPKGIFFF